MKHRILTYLFLAATLFAACTRPHASLPVALTEVDSVSARDPKLALRMLDSLSAQMDEADSLAQMYYELLRVKAQDRAYIRHTTDRQILSVISYFERHPQGDLLAWAYCYGGRVCRDLGDVPRSILYFEKSLDQLADGRNPDLQQRVLSQLGYVFYRQYLFDESRAMKRAVITGDSLAGRYDRMVTCYTDIARCYIGEASYDSASIAARYAVRLARAYQLDAMQPALDLLQAQIASYRDCHAEALSMVTPYLSGTELADPAPYLVVASHSLMALTRYAEAEPICRRLLTEPYATSLNKAAALRNLADIRRQQGQLTVSFELQQQALALLDSMTQANTAEKVTLVGNYYRSQQRERVMNRLEQEKQAAEKRFYLACFVLLALLLGAGLLWLQHKRRLAERLLHREQTLTAFRSTDLCQRIYTLCYAQHPITPELWTEVEDYLNQATPRFLPELRRLTTFGETEWHITLLTRLGFRNVDIATLLCKHRSAISQAKRRLYAKVYGAEGKAEDWDKVVMNL